MTATIELSKTNNDTIELFNIGRLVNLKIGTWSGQRKLICEDMVSVNIDMLLVPKSELQAITHLEHKARKYLAKWSIPFDIASAHFVPINLLSDVERKLSSIREEFFRAVENFIGRFTHVATPRLLKEKFKFEWYTFRISGLNMVQETNEIDNFIEDYISTMRQETINFCELMTARVNEKPFGDETESKKLTGRSLSMFRKHIERFQKMNIFEDTKIEKMLNEFTDNFLDAHVIPSDFEHGETKLAVTRELFKITKQASEFIGQLKKRIAL